MTRLRRLRHAVEGLTLLALLGLKAVGMMIKGPRG